jgi:hypothetical protein
MVFLFLGKNGGDRALGLKIGTQRVELVSQTPEYDPLHGNGSC